VTWGELAFDWENLLVFANERDALILLHTDQLLVTHDGGSTWRSIRVDGMVLAAVAADRSFILEVSHGCGKAPWPCLDDVLISLPVDGYHAAPLEGVPAGMLQLGTQTAPLLVWSRTSVYLSADGGTTWLRRSLPDPHACYEPRTLYVAASGLPSLLFVCDEGTPTPADPKWVYRSTDGGATWQLVARTDRYWGVKPIGRVSEDGRILGLAALAENRAVMVTQADISSSPDGGRHWVGAHLFGWPNGGLVCVGSFDCWAGWEAASTNPRTNVISSRPAILGTTNGGRTWRVSVLAQ
jgi:photosystem II stability/assembly factor-like uncharacterized protein